MKLKLNISTAECELLTFKASADSHSPGMMDIKRKGSNNSAPNMLQDASGNICNNV